MIPPIGPFDDFVIDLAFTLAAIVLCFLVYFKTREVYSLTKHRGISYFRGAFFFLGLSYLFRFLFSILAFSRIDQVMTTDPRLFAPLFIIPLGYFSTIGILYLIFTMVWKRFDNKWLMILGHGLAVLLSIGSFITHSHIFLLLAQSIMLFIAIILGITMSTKKHFTGMRLLYILISIVWLLNLFVTDRRRGFLLEDILSPIISICLLAIIYYKILKWVK